MRTFRNVVTSIPKSSLGYPGGMKVNDERLHAFIRIYEREFGESLTESQAKLLSGRLMDLYERLARPLPSEQRQYNTEGGD